MCNHTQKYTLTDLNGLLEILNNSVALCHLSFHLLLMSQTLVFMCVCSFCNVVLFPSSFHLLFFRLKEIDMSEYDAATYERFSTAVQRQVQSLRIILENLQVTVYLNLKTIFILCEDDIRYNRYIIIIFIFFVFL